MCVCVCVCLCVSHIFFIHSSADGYIGCFHILIIINNALGCICLFKLVFTFCLDIYLGVEFLGHMVVLFSVS